MSFPFKHPKDIINDYIVVTAEDLNDSPGNPPDDLLAAGTIVLSVDSRTASSHQG